MSFVVSSVPGELHLLTLNRTSHMRFEGGIVFEMGGWLGPSTGDGFIDIQASIQATSRDLHHNVIPRVPRL